MFKNGTHFNPVDLVCAVKDYKGNKFNLPDYVEPSIRDSFLIKVKRKRTQGFGVARPVEWGYERLEYGVCGSAPEYVQSGENGERPFAWATPVTTIGCRYIIKIFL